MNKILVIFAMLFVALTASAADKATDVFTLDHQMSQMCEKRIKENLRFEKGISKIDVSLKENTITITYDTKKTDTEKIIQAFKKIGFNAMLCEETPTVAPEVCPEVAPEVCPEGHSCCGTR